MPIRGRSRQLSSVVYLTRKLSPGSTALEAHAQVELVEGKVWATWLQSTVANTTMTSVKKQEAGMILPALLEMTLKALKIIAGATQFSLRLMTVYSFSACVRRLDPVAPRLVIDVTPESFLGNLCSNSGYGWSDHGGTRHTAGHGFEYYGSDVTNSVVISVCMLGVKADAAAASFDDLLIPYTHLLDCVPNEESEV